MKQLKILVLLLFCKTIVSLAQNPISCGMATIPPPSNGGQLGYYSNYIGNQCNHPAFNPIFTSHFSSPDAN